MSFYDDDELRDLGFAALGRDVRISRNTSIYNPDRIVVGDLTRIDDFCVLSAGEGGIQLGRNVHIAVYCSLMGAGSIDIEDFAGLSSRVSVYSSNDDYSGANLTNPTIPKRYSQVQSAPVRLGRHVIVGAGTIILPGVTLNQGAAVGALSLVKKDCEPFSTYLGVPARKVGTRKKGLLALEREYLREEG